MSRWKPEESATRCLTGFAAPVGPDRKRYGHARISTCRQFVPLRCLVLSSHKPNSTDAVGIINMAMVTSSLRPSPFTLHCVSWRNILSTASRRNVLISIRLKSTDVSQAAKDTLPWSDYLAIRRGKRKWEMVCHFFPSHLLFLRLRDRILLFFFLRR
jgi:hypothetical protein